MRDGALWQAATMQSNDRGTEVGDRLASCVSDDVSDAALDDAVAHAHRRYAARRTRSRELADEARRWLPGGNTRSVLDFAPFPFRVAAVDGPYLVDVDGHRYLDLLGNYTAGLLGHRPAETERVLKEAAETGVSVGAMTSVETDAARLICERYASIEQVRITNSGTEANLMAISTMRHHTGRSKVIACRGAYHGGLLYFGDGGAGLLAPYDWVLADFNDTASVEDVFAAHGASIAGVIVEPMLGAAGCIPPEPGFLETVRRLCSANSSLLVFDEVMTSRLALGGAQELLDVVPDMTTLGKYVAGGFNFGAFGGNAEIMGAYDPSRGGALSHSGTFNNNPLTIAGVAATLGFTLTEELLARVNGLGDRLRRRLSEIFASVDVPLSVTGLGSMMNIHGTERTPRTVDDVAVGDDRWKALLFFHLLEAGFYIARRGFISLSADIAEAHVDAFADAVAAWAAEPTVVA